jgi:hypothetical protein
MAVGEREHTTSIENLGLLGVIHIITGICQGETSGVGSKFGERFLQGEEVTGTLAHLFAVEEQVTVSTHGARPMLLLEKSGVNIDTESQVVWDKILARRSYVHGVKVVEVVFELRSLFFGECSGRWESSVAENIVPDFVGHLIGSDAQRSYFVTVDTSPLKQVGDGKVGHVNGRVAQTLHQELLVPWELGSQTVTPGACPLIEPVEHTLELMSRLREVSIHASEESAKVVRAINTVDCEKSRLYTHLFAMAFHSSSP